MKWMRELVLLLLVVGVGAVWYASVKKDLEHDAQQDEALFPGFDAGRVRCIVAENIGRDWHMRIERDEHGGWRLIDPSAVPANFWQVDHLLQTALAARGREVPKSERDPVQLGFSPPRLVLEIEELLDGKSHHERVEFGALDADNRSVNVRVRDHYLRSGRELHTALDRDLQDFKTQLALEFTILDVVHVHREGSLLQEGATQPAKADLDLENTEQGWRSLEPAGGLQLDPTLVMTWLQGLAAMQHAGYYDELGAPVANYGLDDPELRLELTLRDGSKTGLLLARPGHAEGQIWYGMREGLGLVWGFEQRNIWLVGFPLADMLDPRVLRARREDVTTITLQRPEGDLYFTAEGKAWHVAMRRKGEKALDKALWADADKVSALLGMLEKTTLEDFRVGETVPESGEGPALWVAVGGETQGGWFGDVVKGKGGVEYRLFQRRGEAACSLAPLAMYAAASEPIEHFWSSKLVDIAEHSQHTLLIQGLGKDLHYQHNSLGKWSRVGSDDEAKELYPVLDSLCFLRAARYLAPRIPSDAPWDDPVKVEFENDFNQKQTIWVGRSREGEQGEEVEIVYDKSRAVAKDQKLHEHLLAILGKP
ncbi:MAG: DUF4340 domain-containing protein [Planctomycetes bacterium]|nr:DUF4340 domain-containing protein [Planctomycetota bacterium]